MSEKKRVRLEFDMQRIEALKKLNDEFLLVKIYAMATGKNRNFTYISKEDTINAIPSAYYCPVVGHIRTYIDADGVEHSFMGGHDIEITDNWEIKDVTRPYGVIVENSEGWETVNEHGTDVEYLTFNAFLWVGRYPELEQMIYSDEILFNQSMEINIENYRPLEEDSNYWEVLGFTFSAFCLLGKADEDSTNGHTDKSVEHTEPAFINAKVVPYEFSLDEFKKEFSLLKDKISKFIADATVNNEGGSFMAEEIKDVETAVTDVEDTSSYGADETEPVENVENAETADFEEGAEAVNEAETTEEVEETQEETSDNVTEEETNAEPTTDETPDYEAMYNDVKNAYDGLKAEFEAYKADHAYSNADYQILEQYKADKEKAEREQAENELFSSFTGRIGDTDEFADLQANSAKYSLDDLEMRLYAIVGKYAIPTKTEKKTEIMKFSLGGHSEQTTEEDPYGNAREYFA